VRHKRERSPEFAAGTACSTSRKMECKCFDPELKRTLNMTDNSRNKIETKWSFAIYCSNSARQQRRGRWRPNAMRVASFKKNEKTLSKFDSLSKI
jgi:hypothetical protein